MTNFVFEVAGMDGGLHKRGDVIDVFEEHRIIKSIGVGARDRERVLQTTRMPRTNYIKVIAADPQVTIADTRQFLESVFNDPINDDDPHSGGVLHERQWYFKSFPTFRANAQLTWEQAMADLTDKVSGLSAAEIKASIRR